MLIARRFYKLELSGTGTSVKIPVPSKAKTVSWRQTFLGADNPGQNQLLIGTSRKTGSTLATNYEGYLDWRVFDAPWSLDGGNNRNDLAGECDIAGSDHLLWSVATHSGGQCYYALEVVFYDTNCNFLGERVETRNRAAGSSAVQINIFQPIGAKSVAWTNNVDGTGSPIVNRLLSLLDIDDGVIAMTNTGSLFSTTSLNAMTTGQNNTGATLWRLRWEIQANATSANEFYLKLGWYKI